MLGRAFLAGIAGGLVMFIWGAITHMATPLGHMGLSSMPLDDQTMPQLRTKLTEPGFYFFPGRDMNDTSKATEDAWVEKMHAGPHGILIFDPRGGEPMSPMQLVTECGANMAAAFVLALALGCTRCGWKVGAGLGLLAGVYGWLSIDASYWNWYNFPCAMVMASLIEQAVGGLVSGIVVGMIARPCAKTAAPPPITTAT